MLGQKAATVLLNTLASMSSWPTPVLWRTKLQSEHAMHHEPWHAHFQWSISPHELKKNQFVEDSWHKRVLMQFPGALRLSGQHLPVQSLTQIQILIYSTLISLTQFPRAWLAHLPDSMMTRHRSWATHAFGQGFSPVQISPILLSSRPQDPRSGQGSYYVHAGSSELLPGLGGKAGHQV